MSIGPAELSAPVILFAARAERWDTYEAPLRRALARAGVSDEGLTLNAAPKTVDYIVYAPNSEVQDFTPYTRLRAVLNLWAGVEQVVGNKTLTVPLARMVEPGLTPRRRSLSGGQPRQDLRASTAAAISAVAPA